jgi:hypothetical protein
MWYVFTSFHFHC